MTTLTLRDEDLVLATDLYQLTMAAAYAALPEMPRATFELWVRRLPPERDFLVFAGLEQAVASLGRLAFDEEQVDWLRGLDVFAGVDPSFFELLAGFRFRGDLWAMPEGTVFFPGEPVVRVTGSLLEAQLVETLLLSIVHHQTTVASKAARVRLAAGEGIRLAEFGTRRAHGPQAGLWAARAAWLAGFDATSNVLAGRRLGIPLAGTMAHSYVLSFESEREAFAHYRRLFPGHTVHLVDTYDTLEGVEAALSTGLDFQAVRLDSGELGALAHAVRRRLDEAGRPEVGIFVSGDVDEHRLADLRAERAPVDAAGVGTRVAVSSDAPYLGVIYKLVEIETCGRRRGVAKTSAGKATRPGPKQVLRRVEDGRFAGDRVVPADTPPAAGEEPLLEPVVRAGSPLSSPGLAAARERCRAELARLPEALRGPAPAPAPYPVAFDSRLGG